MKDRVIVHNDKVIISLISNTTIGAPGPSAGLIMNYRQCLELIKELINAAGEARKCTREIPESE